MDVSELFNLKGKTALVTGSAQGLGKEIALNLARNGASLVLADILYPEQTARAVEDIGSRALAVQADVCNEDEVRDLAKRSFSEYGQIHILLNNAGIPQLSYTPTENLPTEEWDRIIQVNLRGTFLCCRYIGKQMIENAGGSIINIATTAGITGAPRARLLRLKDWGYFLDQVPGSRVG